MASNKYLRSLPQKGSSCHEMEHENFLVDDESNCSNDFESNSDAADSSPQMSEKIAQALRKLTLNQNMKFMENFDPEKSNRERRKLTRKIYTGGRKQASLYDDKGVILTLEKDLCDCLDDACPGCHFPCSKCRSFKCGHDCRVNRKWMYEQIEVEGTDDIIKNKFR